MPRRDDLFACLGTTWERQWIGGNDGWYCWYSRCGRMTAWRDDDGYHSSVDGIGQRGGDTLRQAMEVATLRAMRAAA